MSSLTIAGTSRDRRLTHFRRACEHYIGQEQEKPLPDTHLIALLGDAVWLTQEMTVLHQHLQALEAHVLRTETALVDALAVSPSPRP